MEKRFRIITPVYNAESWIGKCIESVKEQKHSNFIQIIVDDCSTDGTVNVAKKAIGEDPRFVLIEKPRKLGALDGHVVAGNYEYEESDIFVHLDGDDWFADDNVLGRLNSIYDNEDIWCTYGNYETTDGSPSVNKRLNESNLSNICKGFVGERKLHMKNWYTPKAKISLSSAEEKDYTFRLILATGWCLSQVRSFRGKLWKGISDSDLRAKDGSYLAVADVAVFVPVVEMAGVSRLEYVPEVQMIYNRETPINDDKVNRSKVINHAKELALKEPKEQW